MVTRLAKICATIGPATASPEALERLVRAGMDLARLNFSHGEVAEHARVVRWLRRAEKRVGRIVGVLQDLQGPRIRVGRLSGPIPLTRKDLVLLRSRRGGSGVVPARAVNLPVTYGKLHADVDVRHRILLKDGSIELRVREVLDHGLLCEVVRAGTVTSGAGMNAPDSNLQVPALTARDRRHLLAGLEMGVDAIALSFVRDAADIRRARRLVKQAGGQALIVAKIERRAALDNLDEILAEADGVIVARGDLGVECPIESVPLLQKKIIRSAIRSDSFVMTATQMLESMTLNPTPTRAEVSDVANAVMDGSDTIMLSGETAVGRYPVEAVATMDRIARTVEASHRVRIEEDPLPKRPPTDFTRALCRSAVELADHTSAAALLSFTRTGRGAAILSGERPTAPIIAFTPDAGVNRRLAFYRGVLSRLLTGSRSREELFERGLAELGREKLLRRRDVAVLVGDESATHGVANTLRVVRHG